MEHHAGKSNGVTTDISPGNLKFYKAQRSEEVNEIISHRSGFFEQWALLIFLLVVVLLIGSTWFVKYKDIIQCPGYLTAANAPKEVVPRHEGKLIRLFVSNDEAVSAGQVIGWIESTASHKEVMALDSLLDRASLFLEKNDLEQVFRLFRNRMLHLGDVQASYQEFITSWQRFNDYFVNGYCYKKKQQLLNDKACLQQLHQTLEEQKQLYSQDLQLTEEGYNANNTLFGDKIISKQDLRNEASKLLGKRMTIPQIDAALLNNHIQELNKQKEIDELEHDISIEKISFEQALHTLKSMVLAWVSTYVMKAAVAGKMVFVIPLQENQFVVAGKVVGYVNPTGTKYYVQANLPQTNLGKLQTGQNAQIRLLAYPYQEFGFVDGRLNYISKIPSDSGFLATVDMPKGLTTHTNREIQYRNGLKCEVVIVTRETRLMQKVFYDFMKEIHR